MKTVHYHFSELDVVAKKLLKELAACQIITLSGSLGVGKTTLSAAMLKSLGVVSPVISPTFTYFNQYQAFDGRMIYHFDLYRLKNFTEFEAFGFFEYLDQPQSLVIIEWPEIIQSVLTGTVGDLVLKADSAMDRTIQYQIIQK